MAEETEEERRRRLDEEAAAHARASGDEFAPPDQNAPDQSADPWGYRIQQARQQDAALGADVSGARASLEANYGPAPATPVLPPRLGGSQFAPPDGATESVVDTQGYQSAPPGPAYAAHPSDYSLPLRNAQFQGPIPDEGSPRHIAEQQALDYHRRTGGQYGPAGQYESLEQTARRYEQQNTPVSPENQQPPPGMAFLYTGSGRGGMVPDTPQNRLIDLNQRIGMATLSPSESIRAEDLRNAMQLVQNRVDDGTLPAAAGQQLRQQIQQRGEDLWARQGSVPEMLMRQQFLEQQHLEANRQALRNGNAADAAASVRGRVFDLGNGNSIHVGLDGRETVMRNHDDAAAHAQAVADRRAATETSAANHDWSEHSKLIERLRANVQARYDAAMKPRGANETPEEYAARQPSWIRHSMNDQGQNIDPVELQTRAEIEAHYRHEGRPVPIHPSLRGAQQTGQPVNGAAVGGQGQQPGAGPPSIFAGNAPPGGNAPGNTGGTPPRAVANTQLQTLQHVRDSINNPPTGTQPRVLAAMVQMRPLVEEAHQLSQVTNRTPAQQARYLALDREIDALLNRRIEVPLPRSFFEVGARRGIAAEAPAHPLSPVGIGHTLADWFRNIGTANFHYGEGGQ